MKKRILSFVSFGTLMLIACISAGCGFRNVSTDAGYVGYVTQDAVMGQTKYVGLQTGPSSTGMKWMVNVTNISVTPYNKEESFEKDDAVVANDKLKVQFKLNVSWQITDVKDFVENYAAASPDQTPEQVAQSAYDNYIKPSLHTFTRQEVEKLGGFDIKSATGTIAAAVAEDMKPILKGTPFRVNAIVMSSPQLPDDVVTANKDALQATITLQQKDTEIEIKRVEKDKQVHDAQGIAKAMGELSAKLTPQYLAYEALQIQKDAKSENHSTTYISQGMAVTGTMPVK